MPLGYADSGGGRKEGGEGKGHGFRAGRGTGTATLEAKLLQQLAAIMEEVLYVIFLDLTKAYVALYRSRILEILEGYGVGPRARRILRTYWVKSMVVTRVGGYYRTGFKGARGVTQGDPLSPTIFNVVVDAVVRQWVTLAVEEEEKRGERGKEGRHRAALFYADNGMVASSDPRWLQWAFNTLVGLFERVGLCTNVGKTVSMTCRPCLAAGNQDDGGGDNASRKTKRAGRVRGLREGDGGRVAGRPSDDTAWEGKGRQMEFYISSHGRRGTTHLSDRVPDQGGDEGMPSGGLPRKGQDTDGDEGASLAPA